MDMYTCKRLVGCQAAIAARPAPTIDRRTRFALHHSIGRAVARLLLILIHPPLRQAEWRRFSGGQALSAVRRSRTHRVQEIGRLSGRHRRQASSHRVRCTPARDWLAGRPPSLPGQLPQGSVYTCRRLVGCQAAIAGRPAPTGFGVHLQEIGWMAGRHRRQASCHNGPVSTPPALHHSIGRAVARLLLILIHPPLRQAEWRRLSGGLARSAVRRSRTHREEVVAKQTGGDAPR
ncbi:hypothetical protein HNR03_001815 [Pseudomonas sp. JAI111]|nr:hypothetical protein [Pseudomonas sp. JAI111]